MAYLARFNKSGNIKLGQTWSWSKLAGDSIHTTKDGESCKGSCGSYCKGCWSAAVKEGKRPACYVAKSYRYPSVVKGHMRNTNVMRDNIDRAFDDLAKQIDKARNKPVMIRINQSGEMETLKEVMMWADLAEKHPNIGFWCYTKAFDLVIPLLHDGVIPNNMTILFSIWHEYGIHEYKECETYSNVKAFVYMDGFNYAAYGIEPTTICKAYDDNGKLNKDITCQKCQKCLNRVTSCKIIGCLDH